MRIGSVAFAGALACISTAVAADQQSVAQVANSSANIPDSNALPDAPMAAEQLEAIFMSACFGGAVRLTAEQESPLTIDDLPPNLRRRLGKPVSGSAWRLNSTTPTYLYVINFRPTAKTSPLVCGLASESIEIGTAIKFLGARVNGASMDSLHEGFSGAEWLDAQRGFVAVASKADSFTVLEVKQLSKEQQKRALKIVPNLALIPALPQTH